LTTTLSARSTGNVVATGMGNEMFLMVVGSNSIEDGVVVVEVVVETAVIG
jgi:hypothetical protein